MTTTLEPTEPTEPPKSDKILSIDVGLVNFSYCIKGSDGKITHIDRLAVTHKSVLELFKSLDLSDCTTVIIENQMRVNIKCVRLQQHITTYFMIVHPQIKIVPFSSKHKTCVFTQEKMTQRQRKMWSVNKALEILKERNEDWVIDKINHDKKKDDMADVIMQLEAYQVIQDLKSKKKKTTRIKKVN